MLDRTTGRELRSSGHRRLTELLVDRLDWSILRALEADGRQTFSALADEVGLSKTPCWSRVQALEQSGVIRGYRAVLDQPALGLKLVAFCDVRVEFGAHAAFEAAVRKHPVILECYTTAGDADYLLHVVTSDVERLDQFLREELSALPGVIRSATTICLKRIKDSGAIVGAAALVSGVELAPAHR
jgi:Lrp/AsnC family leucine-responsive transcriptional regulator